MKIAQKRKSGKILNRDGIAERIISIAKDINDSMSYKDIMESAGRIAELVDAASYDEYWTEKVNIGRYKEIDLFSFLIEGKISKEELVGYSDIDD